MQASLGPSGEISPLRRTQTDHNQHSGSGPTPSKLVVTEHKNEHLANNQVESEETNVIDQRSMRNMISLMRSKMKASASELVKVGVVFADIYV